jgi:putative cardiolipin synthase
MPDYAPEPRRNPAGMVRLAAAGALLLGLTACSTIPESPDKPASFSAPAADAGPLAQSSRAVMAERNAQTDSAFMLIPQNDEALRWRLALIDHAQQSIDLQVFIWSNDESGRLMLDRIRKAAERGVQVRILVDDMPKDWTDRGTALVARLTNIQLRRFNPGRVRKGLFSRMFQMSTQFRQLNRRMHNKQMIVDGHWGIVGGRNIGNPYFGLSRKYNNRDLDMLVTGAVIPQMADDFDVYWNADAAYPGEAMAGELSEKKTAKSWSRFEQAVREDRELLRQTRIPPGPADWSGELERLPERMVFGTAQCLRDAPLVKGDRGLRLVDQLDQIGIKSQQQSCIITPYMIPSKEQLKSIEQIGREENRRIRLLVPSMESNNHTMAHSHYKKYRKKLLKAGAELYEFRGEPSPQLRGHSNTPPVEAGFISLHTKAFILDDRWVLLGSLNVDPRSIKINTEHLMLINSPALAGQMLSDFKTMTAPDNAWAVTLNEKGRLRWTSSAGERTRQPARGFWQRCSDFFYRLLPIEGQL